MHMDHPQRGDHDDQPGHRPLRPGEGEPADGFQHLHQPLVQQAHDHQRPGHRGHQQQDPALALPAAAPDLARALGGGEHHQRRRQQDAVGIAQQREKRGGDDPAAARALVAFARGEEVGPRQRGRQRPRPPGVQQRPHDEPRRPQPHDHRQHQRRADVQPQPRGPQRLRRGTGEEPHHHGQQHGEIAAAELRQVAVGGQPPHRPERLEMHQREPRGARGQQQRLRPAPDQPGAERHPRHRRRRQRREVPGDARGGEEPPDPPPIVGQRAVHPAVELPPGADDDLDRAGGAGLLLHRGGHRTASRSAERCGRRTPPGRVAGPWDVGRRGSAADDRGARMTPALTSCGPSIRKRMAGSNQAFGGMAVSAGARMANKNA